MDGQCLPPSKASEKKSDAERLNDAAIKIFSSYRKDLFADPVEFSRQLLEEVFPRFPVDIVEQAADPFTGIVRAYPHWPPNIGEVVNFLAELDRPQRFARQFDEQSRLQRAERDQLERKQKEESPEHRKQVADRILGELAQRGGELAARFGGAGEKFHGETPATVREKFNLTQAQWDAFPNAPRNPNRLGNAAAKVIEQQIEQQELPPYDDREPSAA
jgi:hypothetical protein